MMCAKKTLALLVLILGFVSFPDFEAHAQNTKILTATLNQSVVNKATSNCHAGAQRNDSVLEYDPAKYYEEICTGTGSYAECLRCRQLGKCQ